MRRLSWIEKQWIQAVSEHTQGNEFTLRELPEQLRMPGNSLVKLVGKGALCRVGHVNRGVKKVSVWKVKA